MSLMRAQLFHQYSVPSKAPASCRSISITTRPVLQRGRQVFDVQNFCSPVLSCVRPVRPKSVAHLMISLPFSAICRTDDECHLPECTGQQNCPAQTGYVQLLVNCTR
jgi:hypothetical protein